LSIKDVSVKEDAQAYAFWHKTHFRNLSVKKSSQFHQKKLFKAETN